MAVNVTVYDLENYPDNSKTVTVDQKTVVPLGYEGDEQWVLSFTTAAYSDNTNRTAIQDIYVTEMKAGWFKSSGFVGSNGKFTLVSGVNAVLGIKMDNSANTYYITLDAGVNVPGASIANDMQTKIRNIPNGAAWGTADNGYQLAYINSIVDFSNNRFYIVSGMVSPYYTGANRSSVLVTASGSDACFTTLGFDLGTSSEAIAAISAKEALLASTAASGSSTIVVDSLYTGAVAYDVGMVTNGTYTDYFQITVVSGTTFTIANAVQHTYTLGVSKVQLLKYQDPDNLPNTYFDSVDKITRWGIDSLANQIDFSS